MLVMIAVLITGGMAVAYFGSRDNSVAISANIEKSSLARVSAETGVDLAIAILETDTDWRTNHVNGVILSDFEFGKSTFTISIEDSETQLPPTEDSLNLNLTVQSQVGGVTQTMLVEATVIPNDEEFDVDFSEFAIFAESSIEVNDLSSINRWTASPAATYDKELKVGTLSTSPLSVDTGHKNASRLTVHTPKNASSMVSANHAKRIGFEDTPKLLNPPNATKDATPLSMQQQSRTVKSNRSWKSNWSNAFTNGRDFAPKRNERSITSGNYVLESLSLLPTERLNDFRTSRVNDSK